MEYNCLLLCRLIQEMRFDEQATRIAELLDFIVDMFEKRHTATDNAKLLVMLSDGVNIFAEGKTKMIRAVRRARLMNIFTIFIVIENPESNMVIFDHFISHYLNNSLQY